MQSTQQRWILAGHAPTFAISRHIGDHIPSITITPLEIVYIKPFHSSPPSRQLNAESINPHFTRNDARGHLKACPTQDPKKTRRTATTHISSPALSCKKSMPYWSTRAFSPLWM